MTDPTSDSSHPDDWLTAFFTASTAALAIFDPELRFVRVNQVLANNSGLSPQAHIGRPLREIFPAMADRLEPLLRRVIETQQPVDLEVSGETASQPGHTRYWDVSYFPLPSGPGRVSGVGGVAVEVTARKRAEEELRHSKETLRQLARRLNAVREDEGRRIAREVHDAIGQQLTALKLELQFVSEGVAAGERDLASRTERLHVLLDGIITVAQRIASELRLGHLEVVGLAAAIAWYARHFQRRTGITCTMRDRCEIDDAGTESTTVAFRILQEAMTNVARHSGATEVEISLRPEGANLLLCIYDNGRGISAEALANRRSLGILGMRERAEAVGGTVDVAAAPGGGTLVKAVLPKRPGHHD